MENNNTRCQENKVLCEKMMTFFFGVLLSIAGDEGGIMVKALARHVAPGWYPGVDAICEMSQLLVVARPSLRGRRLKGGKGKGALEKGVLGARETRGAREEGGRETPARKPLFFSLLTSTRRMLKS